MKFTLEQLKQTKVAQSPNNQRLIAEAIKKHGPKADVLNLGAPQPQKLQRDEVRPLDSQFATHQAGPGRVALCVTIIRIGGKPFDQVNLVAGCKELQDAIAMSLGIDDADPRVQWNFEQIAGVSGGRLGTLVKIDEI